MSDRQPFSSRWRVRLGYPLAIVVLLFARPTPRSILYGALVGVVGLWLRAFAAGYLHKQEVLTVTGPYAYTRNPLYLGSAILALGAGIATHSWISVAILVATSRCSTPSSCAVKKTNSAPVMALPSTNTFAPSRFSSRV